MMCFRAFTIISIFLLSSCVHRSVFKRDNDEHKKEVVQYCGGQLWGYILSLDEDLKSHPQLALYTELTHVEKKEVLLLHVAFYFQNAAKFSLNDRSLKISGSGSPEKKSPLDFTLFEYAQNVHQLYPSNKYVVKASSQPNEYVISKMKYAGFFGEMDFALEAPFIFKSLEPKVSKMTTPSVQFSFDPTKDDEVYMKSSMILLADPVSSTESRIVVSLPRFLIDEKEFNLIPFVFNFNRDQIMSRAKDARKCPSLEMMFHWNKSSLLIPNFIID